MSAAARGKRLLESTRWQIVTLLRRGTRTVEEIAAALGLTDNAVRHQLSVLERDGFARPTDERRREGDARKPSVLYELPADAEPLLSRAYPPVLTAIVAVVLDRLPPRQAHALLRDVGRRLAREARGARDERPVGTSAAPTSDEGVRAAAAFLTSLGGDVQITRDAGVLHIRGSGCPLSAAVSRHPELCRTVETLVAEVAGRPVHRCCSYDGRPRCCFRIDAESSAA